MSGFASQKILLLLKIHNKQVVQNFQFNRYFLHWYTLMNNKNFKSQNYIYFFVFNKFTQCFKLQSLF